MYLWTKLGTSISFSSSCLCNISDSSSVLFISSETHTHHFHTKLTTPQKWKTHIQEFIYLEVGVTKRLRSKIWGFLFFACWAHLASLQQLPIQLFLWSCIGCAVLSYMILLPSFLLQNKIKNLNFIKLFPHTLNLYEYK